MSLTQSANTDSQMVYYTFIGPDTNGDNLIENTLSTDTWSDGAGGSGSTLETSTNIYTILTSTSSSSTCVALDTWPASSWPNLPDGVESQSCPSGTNTHDIGPAPVVLEHGDVNVVTNVTYGPLYSAFDSEGVPYFYSASSGWDDTIYLRNAQATMQLYTGGKSVPGWQTIFDLTCSMSDMLSTNPILPQTVSIGNFGKLDSSGHLYVSAPNGTTTAATPSTPGRSWYTFNPGATPIPVTLTANGYNLAQTNPTFCVGQQITFSATLPGLPTTNVSCTWKLSGNYVNATTNNSGGCAIYYTNTSLLQGPTNCQCWYYNGSGGTVSVGVNAIVGGKSLSTAALGQFGIYRPSLTNFTITDTPIVNLYYGGLLVGELLRVGNASGGNALAYVLYVNTTNAGTVGITQIYNDQSYPTAYGSNVLDTAEFYPYPGPPTSGVTNGQWTANSFTLNDSPFESCSSTSGGLILQFTDYARFRPNAGNLNSNIFVTLGQVTWGVDATATNGINGWVTNSGNTFTPASLKNSEQWPFWTTVH